ncbi:hypothetical protein [Streptomyces fuscichromogenes]|uniref:Secreted protein n=1 Tax=Streptomyces fuscichromogenes TaxID=1324013 RepID=A0A917XDA4_9ACTN|nr:hypothetical protein [Streptomyces fuscichromogenes]GGN11384.1 hypothetical protein GCM10011578_037730 [Streptomyces fuscichromogenes]
MRKPVVGTAMGLGAALLLTAGMTTASATPPTPPAARAAVQHPVLVDCLWHQRFRPTDFLLACGDGNSILTGMHWTKWNDDTAVGQGVNVVNDCKPYCAAGKFHKYPVTVRLDRPTAWTKHPNVQHFTRMNLTYSDARPEGYTQVMSYPMWN